MGPKINGALWKVAPKDPELFTLTLIWDMKEHLFIRALIKKPMIAQFIFTATPIYVS